MFYHQVYAQISDTRVMNIVVCTDFEMANLIAKKIYGNDAIAVDCTYWACAIGDKYENGAFYDKDGNEREYKGSEAENISKLKQQVNEDNDTIIDLMYENDVLKDQVEEDNDAILDIDYRVSQLKDKEVA